MATYLLLLLQINTKAITPTHPLLERVGVIRASVALVGFAFPEEPFLDLYAEVSQDLSGNADTPLRTEQDTFIFLVKKTQNLQHPLVQLPSQYVFSHIFKQCGRASVSGGGRQSHNNPTSGKPERRKSSFHSGFEEEDERMNVG